MSYLRVLICRVDDEAHPEHMTELHSFDLPAVEPGALNPETALDELETDVLRVGHQLMRHLLQAEWAEVDERLTAEYQARFSPSGGDAGRV
jgi:hypothetical protein